MTGLAAALRGDLVNEIVGIQRDPSKRKFIRLDTFGDDKISDQEFERR